MSCLCIVCDCAYEPPHSNILEKVSRYATVPHSCSSPLPSPTFCREWKACLEALNKQVLSADIGHSFECQQWFDWGQEDRQWALRRGLEEINKEIEAASRSGVASCWFPMGTRNERIIRLAAKEASLLNSR